MTLTFTEARIQNDNGVWLCLKVNEPAPARQFVMTKQNRLYDLEIKQHREKRSLDANAFCWLLLGKLSAVLQIPPKEIYRQYIPDVGENFIIVPIHKDKIKQWEQDWCKGHDGRVIEDMGPCRSIKAHHNIKCFRGSSEYDSAQMARLIDMIVQDCKDQGIETMTPDKVALLKEEWGHAPTN